ncbi:hypothetical protein FEF65_08845 [Mariprofundus erugo]|uniref:Uncharacterized protein n=1 Tax=Mariprofundus erugo TaxID=2528639 RepID=A0A5R9GPQ8_9PROT|nr:hypothetical protein [Mariprofundus erugo]TLS67045.1 hypothetical protein FEF65_08845 [Mariprofundus erugo]
MQVVSNITFPSATAVTTVKAPAKAPASVATQQLSAPKTVSKAGGLWESGSFSFGDVIDMVNPLQHLPVISTIYRKLTGDEIGAAPRMIGGAIFGGLMGSWVSGLASAMVNAFSTSGTGKDIGEHMMEYAQSTISPTTARVAPTAVAANPPSASQAVNQHPAAPSVVPVQMADIPPSQAQPAGQPIAVTSATSYGRNPMQTAIGQYQQQIIIDDFRKESHYWG